MPRKNISIIQKDGQFLLHDDDYKELMDMEPCATQAQAEAERRAYWKDIAQLESDEASEARGLAMIGGYWEDGQ